MSTNKIEKVINLSNGGFNAFTKRVNKYKAGLKLNNKGIVELIKSPPEAISVITDLEGMRKYYATLYKKFESNTIKDDDKLLFNKSSKYPRATFNRYSTKARRVEKKETKLVIGDKVTIHTKSVGWDTRVIGSDIYEMDAYKLKQFADSLPSSKKTGDFGEYLKAVPNTYYHNTDIINKFFKNLGEALGEKVGATGNIGTIHYYNNEEKEHIDVLLSEYDIDNIVTDKTVSKYVDEFKTTLDEGSYELILNALKNGEDNITMGLKLLENMNLEGSMSRFYALFLNAFTSNRRNIVANKTFNHTGFKSVRKNSGLDKLLPEYRYDSYGVAFKNINMYDQIYSKYLDTEAEKEEFFVLIKDRLIKDTTEAMGPGVVALFKKLGKDGEDS